jgi:hypothetical protein
MTPGEISKLKRHLLKALNELFERVELGWTGTKIYKSGFNGDQIQGGAYLWRVVITHNDKQFDDSQILCFIPFDEIASAMEKGATLILINNSRYSTPVLLSNLEIRYSK